MQFLFTYLYDGGEGWELQITLEEIIPQGLDHHYPLLIGGERACPPADIGDIHHYQARLTALEGGAEAQEPLSFPDYPGFDPERFDLKAINSRLSRLT